VTDRVMIYVQHLLGIGHFRRAALLARALGGAGFEVDLVSGGQPVEGAAVDGVRLHQLPALRTADLTFSALVGADGRPLDEAGKAARRAALLDLFAARSPAALVIETYPFGRRMMRFELDPLLAAAAARPDRPLIVTSIRDILQARRPDRVAESARCVETLFDAVLVHGDPDLIPLDASFAEMPRVRDKVFYTGYMADLDGRPAAAATVATGEVIVSAGGGAVGDTMLETALEARPRSALAGARWRLLAGHNMAAADFEALRGRAPGGVVVERARPDFPALLAGAALSISQAGYNTVIDLLLAGTPAVLVPFAGHGETEQSTRAAVLAARGRAEAVAEDALSPAALAAAIDRVVAKGPPPALAVDMSGMATSARLLGEWLAARR
jgi:predicted glycosyltransferase